MDADPSDDVPSDPAALLARHAGLIGLFFLRFRRFLPPAGDDDGLRQVLRIALLHAAAKYDPSRGVKFATLAYPYLKHAAFNHVKKERCRGFTGIPDANIEFARPAVSNVSRTEALDLRKPPIEWDEETWSEILAAVGSDNRELVVMRFRKGWTCDRIGAEVGLTREGVRLRLLKAARTIVSRCPWLEDEG